MTSSPSFRRRRAADRAVAALVRFGGVGVVLAVLFIAFYLVREALPLAAAPKLEESGRRLPAVAAPVAVGVEDFTEALWELHRDGRLVLRDVADGAELDAAAPLALGPGETVVEARLSPDQATLAVATSSGRLAALPLAFAVDYDDDLERSHRLEETTPRWLIEEGDGPLAAFSVLAEDATVWGAAVRGDGALELVRGRIKVNRLTGAERLSRKVLRLAEPGPITDLALLEGGAVLAGFADGGLAAWRADRPFNKLEECGRTPAGAAVRQIQPLIGAGSALVARADGAVERWMMVAPETGRPILDEAAEMSEAVPGLRLLAPSTRQRVFFALADRELRIGHATAAEYLAAVRLPAGVERVLPSPREDHLLLIGADWVEVRGLELGYPGVTARTLFARIQYEGSPAPAWTWQSTGGSDAYEPKISLVPLILGTFKGTLWALLPSIPLAVLGALFTARFLRGRAREIVKPAVELLAGIPSVILGFVGALYLAPAMQDRMLAVFLLPFVLVLLTVVLAVGWARLPLPSRRRLHEGWAPFLLMAVYAAVGAALLRAGPGLEQALLGAPFREWAPAALGLPFEQRNAAVVGLAMGFAVTPLIFTLAEDAFRNVPETLAEASLALGATPWQTSVRVIFPPALPGVVAAVMLGLGRAVGETMIVLMATGNTSITRLNIFQGFRALSANLAVELPEAPHGESLYRTLFLSALLLFAFTFLVNTAAETIRVRGRKEL